MGIFHWNCLECYLEQVNMDGNVFMLLETITKSAIVAQPKSKYFKRNFERARFLTAKQCIFLIMLDKRISHQELYATTKVKSHMADHQFHYHTFPILFRQAGLYSRDSSLSSPTPNLSRHPNPCIF